MSRRRSLTNALWFSLLLVPATADICSAQKAAPSNFPSRILVLDGSPVHDVGNLRVHASNWGALGSFPGSGNPFAQAPSAEWPAGSRVEYLYAAGIWVGALIDGVPSVSTSFVNSEFRPSSDPRDVVYRTFVGTPSGQRIPSPNADDDGDGKLDEDPLDGFDNDHDGRVDEDFAGISDQMFVRRFRDDDPSSISVFPNHRPLHLAVREESYQFSDPDYDDFVGFTYWITNDGADTLRDVYLGVFADGDVGPRDTDNFAEDDATALREDLMVDHGAHGSQAYDFAYWYDDDGDGGQAPGFGGIVMLNQSVVSYATFAGSASYEDGGDPTNDFERYEQMSSRRIARDSAVPRDSRTMAAVAPFAKLAPGETIEFSFALVVTPRDDFVNVERAVAAYHGLWFDMDGNPSTGIDGKEHQEHWFLPNQDPLPVAIDGFDVQALDPKSVKIAWQTSGHEGIEGFELLRANAGGELRAVVPGRISAVTHLFVDENVTAGQRYQYVLVAYGVAGSVFATQRTGVAVPRFTLALQQNAPNPFRESTTFVFELPARGDVDLGVYDVAGRRVATVVSGTQGEGEHEITWNGTNDAGARVGTGVYFYRLNAGGETKTRKLLIVR